MLCHYNFCHPSFNYLYSLTFSLLLLCHNVQLHVMFCYVVNSFLEWYVVLYCATTHFATQNFHYFSTCTLNLFSLLFFATMYNYMLCSVMFMISFLKFDVRKSEDQCHYMNFEQENQFLFRNPEPIKFQKITWNQKIQVQESI